MALDHVRPWRAIQRRPSRKIRVGSVEVGRRRAHHRPVDDQHADHRRGGHPDQIRKLEEAGADIVRVSCPTPRAPPRSRPSPARRGAARGRHPLPLQARDRGGAGGAACLRINPGNIGSSARVREVVQAAKDHGCSMRIGVNAGSLERELLEKYGEPCPEAMVESALNHARILQDHDFHEFKISVKASDPFLTVAAYQQLAEAIDCPLHLGVTEAGPLRAGRSSRPSGSARCCGRDRRHHPRVARRRSRGGDQGRVRHPQVAGPAPPGREHHRLPELRAAGLQRDRDGADAGRAAGAHRHAHEPVASSAAW
jgi:(E)-4-hydroxy-3-methylbut-2-enyl-diphosphate synthase